MNENNANQWKKEVLGHVFVALAAAQELKNLLIYKGALILNIHLGTERMSLDIDSNLAEDFIQAYPEILDQQEYLEDIIAKAISRYFNKQNPVRFELEIGRAHV